MSNIYRKVGEVDYDGLITGLTPPTQVAGGIVAKLGEATTYVRGTVLAKSKANGKLYLLGTNAAQTSETFNGDGSATEFALAAEALPLVIDKVEVGGSEVTVSSYDASTGIVTLESAPAAGTGNVAVYYTADEMVPDCILCDDQEVGTSADVDTAVYTAGCFNPDKTTVASEYTMTMADKDKLRERGIVFKTAQAN